MTHLKPLLLTDRDVAHMLKVSRGTVWNWASQGIIPQPIRLQNTTRWRTIDIENHVNSLAGQLAGQTMPETEKANKTRGQAGINGAGGGNLRLVQ